MKQQSSALKGNLSSNLQNHHDITGRDLYVGIDVHKEWWQVAVYYQGLILGNTSIAAGTLLCLI